MHTSTAEQIKIDLKEHRLKNGLRLIVNEDHSSPIISFQVWYNVGSKNEKPGITGISHLFEHMMFKGSKNVKPEEHSRIIQQNGGTDNAFTTKDMTAFFENLPRSQLELAVKLEADRMARLRLTADTLSSEREVVKEERRLRYDNSLSGKLSEGLYSTAFARHPYRWPVIGWMSDIDAISLDDCKAFYRAHYAPNNATIIILGDIDYEKTLTGIKETFGDWKKGDAPKPTLPPVPKIDGYKIRIVNKPDLTQTEIRLGHMGIARDDPDYFALMLLNYILGRGPASRLYTRVRAEKGLTYGASSRFEARKLRGPFYIRTYSKNETAIEALRLVLDELKRLKSNGVTKEELDSAKSFYIGHYPLSMETPAQIASKIIVQEFYGLPEDYIDKYLDSVRAVSAEDVDGAIKKVLDPENLVIILVTKSEDILEEAKALGDVELTEP